MFLFVVELPDGYGVMLGTSLKSYVNVEISYIIFTGTMLIFINSVNN